MILAHLPFAVGLSRADEPDYSPESLYEPWRRRCACCRRRSFGLGIGPAVLAHEGSTLVVVFNALRLLAFKDRDHV
jgi:Cd2+/Zn2+-exporting ATPase